nr:MAG TPA: hypothetical protein [Caudoviricetes sp.]
MNFRHSPPLSFTYLIRYFSTFASCISINSFLCCKSVYINIPIGMGLTAIM